jgi:hypothetical protein
MASVGAQTSVGGNKLLLKIKPVSPANNAPVPVIGNIGKVGVCLAQTRPVAKLIAAPKANATPSHGCPAPACQFTLSLKATAKPNIASAIQSHVTGRVRSPSSQRDTNAAASGVVANASNTKPTAVACTASAKQIELDPNAKATGQPARVSGARNAAGAHSAVMPSKTVASNTPRQAIMVQPSNPDQRINKVSGVRMATPIKAIPMPRAEG